MSKAKARNSGFFRSLQAQLHPDLKRTILGILFIAIAAILILALFGKSGPAGAALYRVLTTLFGLGYYLFPTIFLIVAGVFLLSEPQKAQTLTITLIGATLFIIAGLGMIDIVYPDKGGLIGHWIGAVEVPFGYIAGLVLTGTILIISLLMTLNVPLRLKKSEDEEKDIVIGNEDEYETEEEEEEKPNAKKTLKERINEPKHDLEESDLNVKEAADTFVPRKKSQDVIKNYTPPPLSLLKSTIEKPTSGDLRANANIIKRTLESFGIPVEMGEISIGPKVTRYTLKPAEGIKLAKITALGQ